MAVATHSNPVPPAPSDIWGLSIFPPSGLWQDPMAILGSIGENVTSFPSLDGWPFGVYNDGYDGSGSVSILWGGEDFAITFLKKSIACHTVFSNPNPSLTMATMVKGSALQWAFWGEIKGYALASSCLTSMTTERRRGASLATNLHFL